jgi:hypothetical protein
MSPITRQTLLTLLLLPLMFALWYAAGPPLVAPAVWLADQLFALWLPTLVASTSFAGPDMTVVTQFGEINNAIVPAQEAGHQLAIQVNTRLISYSLPFYAALLWASNVDQPLHRFIMGLFVVWLTMAFGLCAIAAKDMMLLLKTPFLSAPWVPPADVIGLLYQFNVLLMPSLLPVALWAWQLRGSVLWDAVATELGLSQNRNG